jgi:hypothetical protein
METFLQILEAAVIGIVVAMAVVFVVVMALCAIAPLFISKDMTEGDDPAVKIGQGE